MVVPHDKHAVLPSLGWYFASLHDTQSFAAFAPNVVLYLPAAQAVHGEEPCVDLYVCGFPCQPNSALNLKRDAADARRDPMECALAYLETKRPRFFVLENVVGLTTVCKGALWNALVDRLDALEGYAWDYRILDPCKHADSP